MILMFDIVTVRVSYLGLILIRMRGFVLSLNRICPLKVRLQLGFGLRFLEMVSVQIITRHHRVQIRFAESRSIARVVSDPCRTF